MKANKAVIVAATRSPIGAFNGAFKDLSAVELGTQTLKSLLNQHPAAIDLVDDVIIGHVLSAGCGQNTARQIALKSGLPEQTSAMTINKVCGSGLQAVMLAAQAIENGDAEVIVAGGVESMSNSPHVLPNSRNGQKMGHWNMVDTMINDGLWDAFNDYHMGITAENIAEEDEIKRKQQDDFAVLSHQRAHHAQQAGFFSAEICPISVPQRRADDLIIREDEGIRKEISADKLAKLRSAFKRDGTVTAGNASSLNDGAAFVIVMSEAKAQELGLSILGKITASASAGVSPTIMGKGPIAATKKALEKAEWDIDQIDLIEANEAFAVQALSVTQHLNLNPQKTNVCGGAIALGHPIGASGCRVLVTLLHQMQRLDSKKGLATLCIGGGMGVSMLIER